MISPCESRSVCMLALGLLLTIGMCGSGRADPLVDMPTLRSSHGQLDILMVARAAPLDSLGAPAPMGWVYDICPRPGNGALSCPAAATDLYGGTRLALEGGDALKIRLVNRLPPALHAKHASEAPYLASNPTNLHTHGLLVSPRYPTRSDPTFGDNVFVLTLNPDNSPLPSAADALHLHSDLRLGYTDYRIDIPAAHPSGIFWFHPHAHGIALNQVSAGLAGMITVGSVLDYVCKGEPCAAYAATLPVRHLLLKDTQTVATPGGIELQDQQDPQFCFQQPQPGEAGPRQGDCPGATTPVDPDDGSAVYPGGKWFFTLNGQPFPSIAVATTQGEIWRIATASGSASYDLRLQDAAGRDMVVQVLAIDGVAVAGPSASSRRGSADDWMAANRQKADLFPCPGTTARPADGRSGTPACATRIVMMPSSRVELWVAYRDASGRLASPPAGGAQATLRTVGYSTGGDNWPAVDLARIRFSGPPRSSDDPNVLTIGDGRAEGMAPHRIAAELADANQAFGPLPDCKPLPPGHGRRLFFGSVEAADGSEGFGLAHEEIDADGVAVPGTFAPLAQYNASQPPICVSLREGNTPNTERWQLVNLTEEDHNFHMHQLRFRVLRDPSSTRALASPAALDGAGVAYDNLPVRHSSQPCNTVQAWHDAYDPASPGHGACQGRPVQVAIPFSVAGDFVYHCHILEHEDGGMMAPIRVRAWAP